VVETILEYQELQKNFGGVVAVNKLNMTVDIGSITSIIGPNGAGKTTIFNLTTGFLSPTAGNIKFFGNSINQLKPHNIASLGIARTFQNVQVFDNMSVLENIMVGRHLRSKSGILSSTIIPPFLRKEEKHIKREAEKWLEFIGMADDSQISAGSLPLGKQRMLEIARALAMEPKLILFDEPASGLNARETLAIGELIGKIKESGVTVVLVEHDMELIMDISDIVAVINFGTRIAMGTPAEIQINEDVITAYLGD
jgi:branched-chain amino acid transport system ATP-binding protein